MLGAKVKVPTPEGRGDADRPQGHDARARCLRLKGRGFTGKDGKRGDQLVAIEVDVPSDDAGAAALRRGLERRRQPARCARGLSAGTECAKPPPNRRKPGASASRACARPSAPRSRRSSSRGSTLGKWSSASRSASTTTASSTPATSPICRSSRCFPSSSSPPPSRICFGQSQDAMLTVTNVLRRLPPDVAATLREPIQEVLTVRTGTLLWLGAIGRAVDRDQLHRDDPRHPAPRLRREILRALLGISARLDADDPRRGACC